MTMLDDNGTTPISRPYFYDSVGSRGGYSIWMADRTVLITVLR